MTNRQGETSLLKFLVQNGVLTAETAQLAEREVASKNDGSTLINWLVGKGVIGEEGLARKLAAHLRVPFVNLAAFALNPAVTGLLKEEITARYGVVPLRAPDGALVVATSNPLDREALRAVEFAVGRRVLVEVATESAVRDALAHAYHLDEALDAYLKGVPEGPDIPITELLDDPTDLRTLMRESTLPPVVKLLNLILLEGIRSGASDVHIEPGQSGVQVRYRIDGMLEESLRLPKWIQDPLTARCKILAKLDITERRVPQDGRLHVQYRDSMVDLRLSSLPTQFGEKVTMRILDTNSAPAGLDQFGLSPRDLQCIRQAMARPEGLILATGPTGSGKTTTLYGMLAEMVSPLTQHRDRGESDRIPGPRCQSGRDQREAGAHLRRCVALDLAARPRCHPRRRDPRQ